MEDILENTDLQELNSGFQFNHQQIGLTYAQANGLSKEDIETFFKNWYYVQGNTKLVIDQYLIAKENHHDGLGIHFHCYCKLNGRLRSRNCRLFDVFDEVTGLLYHPHLSKVHGIKNMVGYCTKEDLFPLCNFDYSEYVSKTPNWGAFFSLKLKSPEEALNRLLGKWPSWTVNHYINAKEMCIDQYGKKRDFYQPTYTNFPNVPLRALSWVDCELHGGGERPLALILIGPSRTGKTEWARSLGRHMYFCNYFDLSIWDDEAEYVIFDDMDIDPDIPLEKYFRSWKAFFGAQKQFTVTDKYCRKKTVKWGKPLIWISNNEINCNSKTLEYIRKNSIRINVLNDLY
nr:MAG: replication protein [Cressdnaviricota sp.]